MARFLLIHGAAHGAWCWRDVLPALRAQGHQAEAIDLPSHGHDTTPAEAVTLADYASAILAAVTEPVILVGHSMGGYPITLAAEMAPENITALVYLTAYTPWPDMSISDLSALVPDRPIRAAIQVDKDRGTMSYDADMVGPIFYHDCPSGTVEYAASRLCAQPLQPMQKTIMLRHSPALPRAYIICTDDRAILPELQRKMAARLPPENIYELESAHSPFFAAPDKLAETLNMIAKST